MNNSIENNKTEILKIRIFAAVVFVVMISGAAICSKYGKHSDHKYLNKLEMFTK